MLRWQSVPRDGARSRALRTWRHRVIHVFTCPSSSLCSASLSFAPYRLQPGKLFLCLAHGAAFCSRRPPSSCIAAHKNPRGTIRGPRHTKGAAWKAQLGGALPSPLSFPPGAMHAAGAASCPSQLCPWGEASWGGSSLCGAGVGCPGPWGASRPCCVLEGAMSGSSGSWCCALTLLHPPCSWERTGTVRALWCWRWKGARGACCKGWGQRPPPAATTGRLPATASATRPNCWETLPGGGRQKNHTEWKESRLHVFSELKIKRILLAGGGLFCCAADGMRARCTLLPWKAKSAMPKMGTFWLFRMPEIEWFRRAA